MSWPSSSPVTDALSTVTENWTDRGLASSPAMTSAPALKTTGETETMTNSNDIKDTTESPDNTDRWSSEEVTDDEEDFLCLCQGSGSEGSGIDDDGSGLESCCENGPTDEPETTDVLDSNQSNITHPTSSSEVLSRFSENIKAKFFLRVCQKKQQKHLRQNRHT